jgi:hypothetical protein
MTITMMTTITATRTIAAIISGIPMAPIATRPPASARPS